MFNQELGNSGSVLEVQNNLIKKSWPQNNKRLEKQIEKQINFIPFASFQTPKILEVGIENENLFFKMEYIEGLSNLEFFSTASKEVIDNVCQQIFSFIDFEVANCKIQLLDCVQLIQKIKSLNIEEQLKNKSVDYINQHIPNKLLSLPVGMCHGDFTFANFIFKVNQIYLIDFLDVFVESPLQDIVKLRQETKGFWSLLKTQNQKLDVIKLKMNFSYMDGLIHEHFSKYSWYCAYGSVFEIINYLRILPYETDRKIYCEVKSLAENIINQ